AILFYVSNISYVNNSNDFFVLNRDNGQPLSNASVQVWQQRYDYKTSKNVKEKAALYKTDANGFFRMVKNKENNERAGYLLDITYNNERFFMDDLIYNNYYDYNRSTDKDVEENGTRIFLFLDRSIYRPAQTVYFKGIVIAPEKTERKNKILSNYETIVYLRDDNYQNIDSQKIKTNEFGSFSGKFQLPQRGLNGQFSIYTVNNKGIIEFRVEDYKRPKFYVEYEKIKGTYKLNDKIKITGTAKAYAGNNIDDASVKFRVVRQPRFPYPWLFWRWWQPYAEPMEIAHGEAKTDKDGKFNIEFTAIPDLKIEKKFEPVFDYRIYADITDINGETRTGETIVSVSYKILILNISVPASLPVDSLKTISIRTQNLGGEFVPAKVNVSIYQLKPENRLIRNRYWQQPDQFVMNKDEFLKYFPHDEYKNEADYRSWEKEEKVFERSDSTRENFKFEIQNSKFPAGWYQVEVETKDKNGEIINDVKYVELYDEKTNQLVKPQYLWTKGSEKPIEPEEKTNIQLGSSADNLFIVNEIDKTNALEKGIGQPSTANYSFIHLNNEKKTFNFTATEADRGGYGVNYFFVKHNRFYQFGDIINVPWTNKELKIEYATFRDKTLPGREEKWNLKISGYKNEKVAAEMLASMYDASLDQFAPNSWDKPSIWPTYGFFKNWNGTQNFMGAQSNQKWLGRDEELKSFEKRYDEFFFKTFWVQYNRFLNGKAAGIEMQESPVAPSKPDNISIRSKSAIADSASDQQKEKESNQPPIKNDPAIQIRKNFNETAFFFPDLKTDENGNIEFSFIIPEALTRWKFQALSHTKDLALGLSTKEIITQKQLMVQPNAPRFLREGDRMEFSAKIVNLTDKEFTGQAELQLFDAATNQPVNGWFQNSSPNQFFSVEAGQSEVVLFPLQVPYQFNKALTWRIVAKAGAFSDGEEAAMPVLTNRMLVTETLPLHMGGTGTKNFRFDKLVNSQTSETLQYYALTVEYTSNPAWYVVQALPFLIEYPYECAEQTWNRYYANSLATKIVNSSPRIKQIFEQWKTKDTSALLSNLQKNQELKSVLLEETPWVLEAKNEEQQKKNIALLFDMIRMSTELNNSLEKLKQMQSENGGFVWFKGGPDDRYITQYIVSGIGHLKKLNGITKEHEEKIKAILKTAIPYLDKKLKEDYDAMMQNRKGSKSPYWEDLGGLEIQYLYMRSFFQEYNIPKESQTAYYYYRKQAQQSWTKQSKYMQGMIALALYRTNDAGTPSAILKSLKETSINNEELGMYWKELNGGWFWYQAPIETQSLLIEAFNEIEKDTKTVDDLRTWLLKNKQTNNWRTTKATAEACYALLLRGTEWLTYEPTVEIKLGSTIVSNANTGSEAGTGYFKKTIEGEKVNPQMGNISVSLTPNPSPNGEGNSTATWGGV
ncbi:MAG: MG2 domain-containing protein, partial [Bacteroidota bacterium]|nr:MG2 domain-containing protein [Bacteroidota bacterium]